MQVFLSNPQNLNRYSYCRNNPLSYVDPAGLFVVITHGADKGQGKTWAERLKKELIKRGVKQDIYLYKWGPSKLSNFGIQTSKYSKGFISYIKKIKMKYNVGEPVNVLAHSAGTVLVNKALKQGLKINNAVLLGSPISFDVGAFRRNANETHFFESNRDVVNFLISGGIKNIPEVNYHIYKSVRHNDWVSPWNIDDQNIRESILSGYSRILEGKKDE